MRGGNNLLAAGKNQMFNIQEAQYREVPRFEMPKYFDPRNSRSGKRKAALATTLKYKKIRASNVMTSMQVTGKRDFFEMKAPREPSLTSLESALLAQQQSALAIAVMRGKPLPQTVSP